LVSALGKKLIARHGFGGSNESPVMRAEHDGQYAAVASKSGAPEHPTSYHNLVAEPLVELQDGPVRRDTRARIVTGEERTAWWERADAAFPHCFPTMPTTSARPTAKIPVFLHLCVETSRGRLVLQHKFRPHLGAEANRLWTASWVPRRRRHDVLMAVLDTAPVSG
jgi:deazaflavin-dependent oxidoreductase (nitroreductase family)